MPRTPREVGKQVQEAVNEQVRDLPLHAARLAMFGVGRTLLLTDRVTKDYKDLRGGELRPVLDRLLGDAERITHRVGARLEGTPVGRVIELVAPKPAPAPKETPVARPPRAAESNGTGEISVGKPARPATVPPPAPQPEADRLEPVAAPEPAPAEPEEIPAETLELIDAVVEEIIEPEPVPAATALTEADLPVPNYGELTHASIRARLRKLTAGQVEMLREYEAAHAARAALITMYDNRLAKLAQQG
ncbi:hypothetical protein [Actinocorallia populi]|uniref:hypothetical protein n=1 Tax=Actinocorallia populi TaxID=2079200 RepID=UPI0013002030|nr:hypothetical protein [Actinocorallia populi]